MSTIDQKRFAGKVALITGASTGIGAAIAERLAAEGASVAINGRRIELLTRKVSDLMELGYDVMAVPGDISVEAGQAVRTVVNHYGRLDILINNAATAVGLGIEEMTSEAWQQVIAINLSAAFEMVSNTLPHLAASRGCILHISSIGVNSGIYDDLAYVASKAGLEGFSRKLALEVAEKGIRSNVIRPGLIMTEAFSDMPIDFFESQVPLIPLQRMGDPADIAAAAAFLCSSEAGFITGAVLAIDGGESAK